MANDRVRQVAAQLEGLLPRNSVFDRHTGVVTDVYVLRDVGREAPAGAAMGNEIPMEVDTEGNVPVAVEGLAGAGGIGPSRRMVRGVGSLLSNLLGAGGVGGNEGPTVNVLPPGRGGGGSGGPGGNPGGGGDASDPLNKVSLDDVGGLEEQKTWLRTAVLSHLKNDSEVADFGVTPPKGILFYGPPGTGKTLLARAFGNTLSVLTGKKVSFFHRRGPDVYSPWFGESSRIIREIFDKAAKMKPSIIFFDELDGLCPSRDGLVGDAAVTVVTTLLGCMDNLPAGEVFVFGATNMLESVDPAMRRPGRFDKHLEFFPPGKEARRNILQIHTRKWKRCHPSEEKLVEVAGRTAGYSGADLEKLAREVFFCAFERSVPSIYTLNAEETGIEDMQITERDWNAALKKTQPSPAVFGSSMFIPPKLPSMILDPLIRQTQEEILRRLLPKLPQGRSRLSLGRDGEGDVLKGKTLNRSSHVVNSIFIVDKEDIPMNTVDTYILPGVFAQEQVSEVSVYLLSAQRLHSSPQGPLKFLTNTIKQVVESSKPSILYIPRVDVIIAELEDLFLPLAHQLHLLKGKDVLVLTTSGVEPSELPEQMNFRNIFAGDVDVLFYLKPSEEETKNFLAPVFEMARNLMRTNAQGMRNVDAMWRDATRVLDGASLSEHANFYDRLRKVINKTSNDNGKDKKMGTGKMMEEMGKIVKGFQSRTSANN